MKKIEMDIAYDDPHESLQDVLVEWGEKYPDLYVRIVTERGPAGGWPVIELLAPETVLVKFLEDGEFDDIEYHMSFAESVDPA